MINILKDIKEYARIEKERLKEEINHYSKNVFPYNTPGLLIIQTGDSNASNRYVKNKIKDCNEVGIYTFLLKYKKENDYYIREQYHNGDLQSTKQLSNIDLVNKDIKECIMTTTCNGIIIQLPTIEGIDNFNSYISDDSDVDGFKKSSLYKPATPLGIINYLEYCKYPFKGKNVCLIGRGNITNRPLVNMLLDKDMTVTICHSKTNENDLQEYLRRSDLIICAVGKSNFLDCSKYPNKTIIDVGINFDENGKLVGDCFNKEVYNNCTPVPNGIGLTTRLSLLQNVVQAYKIQNGVK